MLSAYLSDSLEPVYLTLLIGLALPIAAWMILRSVPRTSVFDVGRGAFWRGKFGAYQAPSARKPGAYVSLSNMVALQIESPPHPPGDTEANSQILTLVLNDNRRVMVVAYDDRDALVADAYELAALIDKPVRDANAEV